MIQIGEKIKLQGFEGIDPAAVIVIKKIIGSFVKQFYLEHGEFESFNIIKKGNIICSELVHNNKKITNQSELPNLFFSLAETLNRTKKFINSPEFHIAKRM